MRDATGLSALGALIGDPARARMLTALMGGTALTATELAVEAGVAPSTASSHLSKLTNANVLAIEKQGRHHYFRLADEDIAEALESLIGAATRGSARVRTGPADPALRSARVCYDHLAGSAGVWMYDRLQERGLLNPSPSSEQFFSELGVDLTGLARGRRPLCRTCLDWSERRHHLGGALGAALLARFFALRWARSDPGSRAVVFSANGERAFRQQFR
jgi:DNA-binding transcriptional ArsR family regulator